MIYIIPLTQVKRLANIDSNIDDKTILLSLKDAQEIILEPAIGTPLYEAVTSGISNSSLSATYQKLVIEKIWPVLIPSTVFNLTYKTPYRFTNTSITKDDNDNSKTVDYSELNQIRKNLEDTYKHHLNKLLLYLNNNMSSFPEYIEVTLEGYNADDEVMPIDFFYDPELLEDL
jgi:hypothetical protein